MASRAPGRQHAKRGRRGFADPQDALSSSDWTDWANLTDGPAGLIVDHLLANDVADYIRFRATCTAWRALFPDPRLHEISDQRFHPRHWIMLPIANNINRRRRFENVCTGDYIYVGIPDGRLYYIMGATTEGFLVLCKKGTHIVHLLNPITGQVTDLPCAATLMMKGGLSTEYIVSCLRFRGAGLTKANTVVLLCYCYRALVLAVAKPGEKRWTQISLKDHSVLTALPVAGRMYCVTDKNVLVVETGSANEQPRLVAVADYELVPGSFYEPHDIMYLVFDEREEASFLSIVVKKSFKPTGRNWKLGTWSRFVGLVGKLSSFVRTKNRAVIVHCACQGFLFHQT